MMGHSSPREASVLILVGPSGSGKTTLNSKLIRDFPDTFENSISCTTRAIRAGEKDGVNYTFVSKEDFDRMLARQEFVEFTNYVGSQYGTPKSELDRIFNLNKVPILEIDIEGYKQFLAARYPMRSIFVMPPDLDTIRRRLIERGLDSLEAIERRMKRAVQEIEESYTFAFDVRLTNEDLELSYSNLVARLREWYPMR